MKWNETNCERCGKLFSPPFFGRTSRLCPECRREEEAPRQRILTMADVEDASRTPWTVTSAIGGACAAVFLGMVLSGVSPLEPTGADLIRWGANFTPLTLGGEPWRLFTSMFVHVGLIHLAFNMWAFWSLGRFSEQLFGRLPFLFLYLLSGLGGALASVWWHPMVLSAGASGAIFGVAGAMFSSLYLKSRTVPTQFLKRHVGSIGSFIVYNLAFGLVIPQIDNAAHVGGLLTGAVIGALLPAPLLVSVPTRSARTWLGLAAATGVLGLVTFGVLHADSTRTELSRGKLLMAQDRYAEAIPHLQKAVEHAPDSAYANFALGFAYLHQEDYPNAAAALGKAVQLDPGDSEARLELGYAQQQLGRLPEAEASFQEAARLDPGDADKHFYLGACYLEEKKYGPAVAELQRALEINPQYDDASKALKEAQAGLDGQKAGATPTPSSTKK